MADPTKKLSIAEFAQRIKQRAPELAQIPDEELVRKVLERRPEMLSFIQTSEARPERLKRGTDMSERVFGRMQENIAGTPKAISQMIADAQQRYSQKRAGGTSGLWAAPQADIEAIYHGLVEPLGGVTMPGVIKRLMNKEDPASIIGDLSMMMIPGGEDVAAETHGMKVPGAETTRAMARTTFGVPMQELAGAGREPVLSAQIAYQKALTDWQRAAGEQRVAYADKVQKARADWVEKAMAAKRAEGAAAQIAGQRQTLTRGIKEYAERLQQNLKSTHQTVKGRLDGRWDSLRKTPMKKAGVPTILKDELLDSTRIYDAVDKAERKYLQGAPESIKQFRELVEWIKAEGKDQVEGRPRLRPITWDEARTHYTALGNRMYSGDLPGNMKAALSFVRDEGLGEQLRAGAGRAGALDVYQGLLKDWSQYESDWLDTSSVGRGKGSPLAIARLRPNAASLIPDITGKTGDLFMQRLGRYRDAGASMGLAEGVRKLTGQMESLEKPPSVKMPAKFEPPTPPKPGEPPTPVDPADIRRKILRSYSGRRMGWWERMFPPLLMERGMFKIPSIQEAIARVPRNELPVPGLPRPGQTMAPGRTPPPLESPAALRQPFPRSARGPEAEPELEMLRRGGGGPPPGQTFVQQAELVNNLRALYERQRAAGLGEQYITAQKLRAAEEALPKTQGQNYTAADLDAIKKKYGAKWGFK